MAQALDMMAKFRQKMMQLTLISRAVPNTAISAGTAVIATRHFEPKKKAQLVDRFTLAHSCGFKWEYPQPAYFEVSEGVYTE